MTTVLKDQRVRRGLTQSQFGELAGMPQGWVSFYENRKKPCGLKRADRIARALFLARHELFDANGMALPFEAVVR